MENSIEATKPCCGRCCTTFQRQAGGVLYISWNNTGISHIKLEYRSDDIESNSNGESAMHQAAKTGHESTIQIIKLLGAVFETGRAGPALTSLGPAFGLWTKPGRPSLARAFLEEA
jgi:hypothetical protein